MKTTHYQLVRSDRKSIALVIDNEANLIVRAPLKMPFEDIETFIQKKHRWIQEKQKQVDSFGEKHSKVIVQTGESIMYMGDTYAIVQDDTEEIHIAGNEIQVPTAFTIENVVGWMKEEATRIITERVNRYANIMGVTPGMIKMSEAKARWGSCGTKNNLNFAWRLVMCPLYVIDYVVVHELSHITYKDHSSAFWTRVRTVYPKYEDSQEWLKVNRKLMEII